MTTSSIEWTDKTWNPVRGCSIVSPGCHHCYAMKQAHRFSGAGRAYEGLTKLTTAGPQWTGKVVCDDAKLLEPLSWRKPCRVFVNSMSDLFHKDVPDAFIDKVFAVMALADRHVFQVLTKRAERMRAYVVSRGGKSFHVRMQAILQNADRPAATPEHKWPLLNVWLGVSVEDQQRLDERLVLLRDTPAAVRFLSCEPLLERIDFEAATEVGILNVLAPYEESPGIDWVIVGGESGPGARRCSAQWVRSIARQCKAAKVPVFVKQMGANIIDRNDAGFDGCEPRSWPEAIEQRDAVEDNINGFREEYQGADVRVHLLNRKGGDPAEWPEDLRVREFPGVRV